MLGVRDPAAVNGAIDVVVRAKPHFFLHAAAALVAFEVACTYGDKVLDEKRVAKHFSHGLGHVTVAPPGTRDPVAYLGLVCG